MSKRFDKGGDEEAASSHSSGLETSPGDATTRGLVTDASQARHVAILGDPSKPDRRSHSPFWEILYGQLRCRAEQGPETLEFHWAEDDGPPLSQELMARIAGGKIHGLIGLGLSDAQVKWIRAHVLRVPMVGFAQAPPHLLWYSPLDIVEMAVPLLVSRGCGCIAYWQTLLSPGQNAKAPLELSIRERFLELLREHNRPFYPHFYAVHHLLENRAGLTSHEMGYRVALEFFSGEMSPHPDGIIIAEDTMTVGALAAMRHLGIVPGRDVHIVSHANAGSPLLFGAEKELVLVEYDTADLVRELFDMLRCLWDGEALREDPKRVLPHLRDEVARNEIALPKLVS
jgi:DNA-binding LacI/PurR family transcriptional regulator